MSMQCKSQTPCNQTVCIGVVPSQGVRMRQGWIGVGGRKRKGNNNAMGACACGCRQTQKETGCAPPFVVSSLFLARLCTFPSLCSGVREDGCVPMDTPCPWCLALLLSTYRSLPVPVHLVSISSLLYTSSVQNLCGMALFNGCVE